MSELEQVRAELGRLQQSLSKAEERASKADLETLEFTIKVFSAMILAGVLGFAFLLSRT
jgi:hypothetical protein